MLASPELRSRLVWEERANVELGQSWRFHFAALLRAPDDLLDQVRHFAPSIAARPHPRPELLECDGLAAPKTCDDPHIFAGMLHAHCKVPRVEARFASFGRAGFTALG